MSCFNGASKKRFRDHFLKILLFWKKNVNPITKINEKKSRIQRKKLFAFLLWAPTSQNLRKHHLPSGESNLFTPSHTGHQSVLEVSRNCSMCGFWSRRKRKIKGENEGNLFFFVFLINFCLRRCVNTSEVEQQTKDRVLKSSSPKSILLLSCNVKTRLRSSVHTLRGLQNEPLWLSLLLL